MCLVDAEKWRERESWQTMVKTGGGRPLCCSKTLVRSVGFGKREPSEGEEPKGRKELFDFWGLLGVWCCITGYCKLFLNSSLMASECVLSCFEGSKRLSKEQDLDRFNVVLMSEWYTKRGPGVKEQTGWIDR